VSRCVNPHSFRADGKALQFSLRSTQAKLATNDLDVRCTWILFGDPSMKIR